MIGGHELEEGGGEGGLGEGQSGIAKAAEAAGLRPVRADAAARSAGL